MTNMDVDYRTVFSASVGARFSWTRRIAAALQRAKTPMPPEGKHHLIVKSVSAKQRPRRPA